MAQIVKRPNTNGAIAPTMDDKQSAKLFNTLVLKEDLKDLSEPELVEYYKIVCERLGLDPYRKPFDVVTLSGKKQLYPNKECAAQLTATRNLRVDLVSRERLDDMYIVTARASFPEGHGAEDIGVVNIAGMKGDPLANAMMKAVTKAKRRATLTACGLGMTDESERETMPGVAEVDRVEIKAELTDEERATVDMWRETIAACASAEALTEVFTGGYKSLPENLRAEIKDAITSSIERLRVKWVKDHFEPIQGNVQTNKDW